MRRVFLYGDIVDNFESVSAHFIEAAGGSSAKIALLLMGGPGWKGYLPRYRDPWAQLGAVEVIPIAPLGNSTELSSEALACLRSCTGIFIGGGDTPQIS
jgi:cyanophycinase-like exopeptidase